MSDRYHVPTRSCGVIRIEGNPGSQIGSQLRQFSRRIPCGNRSSELSSKPIHLYLDRPNIPFLRIAKQRNHRFVVFRAKGEIPATAIDNPGSSAVRQGEDSLGPVSAAGHAGTTCQHYPSSRDDSSLGGRVCTGNIHTERRPVPGIHNQRGGPCRS